MTRERPSITNQWIPLTGGPSTGKTTLINSLQKLDYTIVPEAGRRVIDGALVKGISIEELRASEPELTYDIMRLKQQDEAELDPNKLTFLDRGMHDTEAYLKYYGHESQPWIDEQLEKSRYPLVFLLDHLEVYDHDYAREEASFSYDIQPLLREAYSRRNIDVVSVPPVNVEKRVEYVLGHIARIGFKV